MTSVTCFPSKELKTLSRGFIQDAMTNSARVSCSSTSRHDCDFHHQLLQLAASPDQLHS
ncbi:hypothetical protein GBAR_LOCUS3671 [Geodia barretti]|uniref:Uncharacterized protein n=1 Tax=Geodia barretti TaxID=519541 RepID=A0AA35R5B5_GEOBA|nr:hypothetical protein GBAR_LOCUS3671 [Geodia barretti]